MEEEKNTKISNRVKKNIIIHPWLLALAPIISLYDHNKDVADPHYLIRPLLISLISVSLSFVILKLILKNSKKAAIITSLFTIIFFLFSYLFSYVALLFEAMNGWFDYQLLALMIFLIFCLALFILIAKSQKPFNQLTTYLNIFSVIILLWPTISIVLYQAKDYSIQPSTAYTLSSEESTQDIPHPDIYYIILDGYARADVLKNLYNYDNSDFIKFLENKGFYVASEARTNYAQTNLSLGSSLNLDYIDKILGSKLDPNSNDRKVTLQLIKDNKVYDFLKPLGYKFVSLPATWEGNYKNTKADISLGNNLDYNDFEGLIIDATPIGLFSESNFKLKLYQKKFNFIFDSIKNINNIKEPTFTYIHLICPHPPFIFDKNGDFSTKKICTKDGSHYFAACPGVELYRQSYAEQLSFLNKKTEEAITQLLANSAQPPIIIIQSDHGPGSGLDWASLKNTDINERMSILNAYYVPETMKQKLYPKISPVNTFRLIFNTVFNAKLELLEDKSYFSIWNYPYRLTDVTAQLK